jgi:ribonucleoside-diphosphate reductase alpha chain
VASPDAISRNALEVLERRYLARDATGAPSETPGDLFRRVARAVARAEEAHGGRRQAAAYAERFEALLAARRFLPNSPTLMNAGRPLAQLAACFVLPLPDSIAGIFETLKHTALIHQSGGGTGFSFSRLRPRGARVASSGGRASGPVSFLRVFNVATDAIKQGGTRRGANMGILRIDHPDILEFIDLKRAPSEMVNFNLSVAVTDAFMEALELGRSYTLVDPRDGRAAGELDAALVFDRLVDAAWQTGDPGVLFLDRVNALNPTADLGPIEATNPCGEQPLHPYEACNLGSINLAGCLLDDLTGVDWERLAATVQLAVRFLDDVIEVNRYPLPAVEAVVRRNRRIGLGVMGFADLLIELGIPYDSEAALRLGEQLMESVQRAAVAATEELAAERGPFPGFATSRHAGGPPRRNATVTTVAPTGSIAMIADCSSGIEPLFAVSYVKRVLDGSELTYVHPGFERRVHEAGLDSETLRRVVARTGGVRELAELPEAIRRLFPTSHDLGPLWHVKMQAAFQRHTENAVSKTVNLPRSATRGEVREIFRLAGTLGLKGITVYRDGSREGQVLERGARTAELDLRPLVQTPDRCPECGGPLAHREGCRSCPACGLSVC